MLEKGINWNDLSVVEKRGSACIKEKYTFENKNGEITERTHLSRPAVSHHIKILLDAEVIGLRRQATMNFYYLKLGGAWGELVTLVNHIEEVRKTCECEEEE